MGSFATYLFRSVIWLTGFALVYLLFLRNERFFLLKRIYLLTGILVSLICPLFTIHYQVEVSAPVINSSGLMSTNVSSVSTVSSSVQDRSFDYQSILLFLYLGGVVILISRLFWHILLISRAIRKSTIITNGKARLVKVSGFRSSFSFFNYVFINPSIDDNEAKEIVNHELVHINQKHWLDLMLTEILRIFQWMNPFAWIYTGFIRVNHEYMADKGALQSNSDPAYYRAALLNQLFRSPVLSLSHSFNYSLNKKRFDMMKKITTSSYRKLKVLIVLPVIAGIFYAFATPEYNYVSQDNGSDEMLTIYESAPIVQKEVRGITLKEDGKPFPGVSIAVTGTNIKAVSDDKGNFIFINVPENSFLVFSFIGYKTEVIKAVFTETMNVKLLKDPDYKASERTTANIPGRPTGPRELVVVDGVITDKNYLEVVQELGYNLGPFKLLSGQEAIEKYGEKGANGVREITTRKKALEMGMKVPFIRLAPTDYPTFQGQRFTGFTEWVRSQAKYPEEARTKNIEGWVTVNFTVELDGTISNVTPSGTGEPLLMEEIKRIINSSPKWDPPENPEVDSPFPSTVTLEFRLPDQIISETPFVVVEEMPMYPGGELELLRFIAENTHYPDSAKAQGVEGRVIVRFIVTTEGNVEGLSVIKGVHPLLDAEAIRVVSMLSGFNPGMQGGRAVNVWYMVPITFTLK